MDAGSPSLLRYLYRGRVWWAMPVTVVEDSVDRTALFRRSGTAIKAPVRSSATDLMQKLAADEYDVDDSEWYGPNLLEILRPGRWHSVWPTWDPVSWAFKCWYVNFQEPMRRSRFGWDTMDLQLDIVVYPDRNWRWKDEDHFEICRRLGVISRDQAAAVTADAEVVIADIEAGRYPYDRDWSTWRPNPAWEEPSLPEGWDVP